MNLPVISQAKSDYSPVKAKSAGHFIGNDRVNGTLPKRGQNLMTGETFEENGYRYLMIFLTENRNFRQHGSPGTGGVSEKLVDSGKRLSKSG